LPPAVREAFQDRDYPSAARAIDQALAAKDAPRELLGYLKGWALCLHREYDAGVAALAQVEKEFPHSPWARRARFSAAWAQAHKGDFRAAELRYRAEVEQLLSPQRRHEFAREYRELADGHFKPRDPEDKPNYEKALELYQHAADAEPQSDDRIEAELLVGQCQQHLGQLDKAAETYARFVKNHPQSPLTLEARYRLGECHLKQKQYSEARRAWEDLLAAHAQGDRVAEASFRLAETWQLPSPPDDAALNRGVAALTQFLERFAGHKLAGQACLRIAQSYLYRQRYAEAVVTIDRLLADRRAQEGPEAPEARRLLGRAYQAQRKYPEALAAWRDYLTKHPAHEAWNEVQGEVIRTEYLVGLDHYTAQRYEAARKSLTEFSARYPLDPRNPAILYLLGQIEHQQKHYQEAILEWRRLVSKFPGTEEASQAQVRIAATLEQDLGRLEQALEEYRKLRWGSRRQEALEAAARMTTTSMALRTPRVFRSGEVPQVTLTTRNVEAVTLRLYRVDLETYFRKMHTTVGAERLDVALIEPDTNRQETIPEYRKYQERQTSLPVPLGGNATCGAMVVSVATRALEANTLLVHSDLDVIVKCSRDEVFVFAENVPRGKPWPGVRILVSDGRRMIAEGTADSGGIFRRPLKNFTADQVRVFATADGHVASTTLGMSGSVAATAISDKGYIYSDRPIYRPGEIVRVRGCIRRAADDTYLVDEGRKLTLEVIDARNRSLWWQDVRLDRFGCFHAAFALPGTSSPGSYRIAAYEQPKHAYQGSFEVTQSVPDSIRLSVDLPRRVYYRGELIQGVIRASYAHGAPLAGRRLSYFLPGAPKQTAQTDARGEASFQLPTRDLSPSQTLPITVQLADEAVEHSVNVVLASQGFTIELRTARPVFLAGETFELTAKTTDAEGKPSAEPLQLKIEEETLIEGRTTRRPIESHTLATSADTGTGHMTLKLPRAGRYHVRAEGIDRFGLPVSADVPLEVSGDDDEIRLRILADRHTWEAGQTAEIPVHWRNPPALALVTCEGATVLDHRLVELHTGINTLSLPMTAALAPNFELSVAVISDCDLSRKSADAARRMFHQASSPLVVHRRLDLRIDYRRVAGGPKSIIGPGDEIEVTLTTTDLAGHPVPASASLAVVHDGSAPLPAAPQPGIEAFFARGARAHAMRTGSSAGFSSFSNGMPINPRLLGERQRQELADEEAASRRAAEAEIGSGGMFGGAGSEVPARSPTPSAHADFAGLMDLIAAASATQLPSASRAAANKRSAESTDDQAIDAAQAVQPGVEHRADPFATGKPKAPAAKRAANPESPSEKKRASGVTAPDTGGATAYWNPAIVTDAQGRARVRFRLPDHSETWLLTAQAVTADTLAGQTRQTIAVRKPLAGELKLPGSAVAGDQLHVPVLVHNAVAERTKAEVLLHVTYAGRTVSQTKSVEFSTAGTQELSFRAALDGPDAATADPESAVGFELIVRAEGRADVVRRSVPVRPFASPVFRSVGGVAGGDVAVSLEPPAAGELREPHLEILIGPSVEQSLLDVLFGRSTWCQRETGPPAGDLERATSDLLAALAVARVLNATPEAGGAVAAALDVRVRRALGQLVSVQGDDGGWSWCGGEGVSDRYRTARIVWALRLARGAGYSVPDDHFDAAVQYLKKQAATLGDTDFNSKAVLLHALATAEQGDFGLANHLYRQRQVLSAPALAYLAMTMLEMDRRGPATELLALLAEKKLDGDWAGSVLPCEASPTEVHAMEVLAAQVLRPNAPRTKQLVDALLAARNGHRWTPDRATGPAALALCAWLEGQRSAAAPYRLSISVNGTALTPLDLSPTVSSRVVTVPARLLQKGKQQIRLTMNGRGRYTYQCVLGGLVPADQVRSTAARWTVERSYEPALLEVDGRVVSRGFFGAERPQQNPLTQLPAGRRGNVELRIQRPGLPENVAAERLEYLVVTEPVPAGVKVLEQSIQGGFERYELLPGRIVFYLGNRRLVDPIRYQLCGWLPGKYRVGPTLVEDAYRPGQVAVSATKTLEVLPAGAQSADPYRLSPQELLELGRREFAEHRFAPAAEHLSELVEKHPMAAFKDAVRMLLDIHLASGPAAKVVQYCEMLKEKWPEEEIAFDQIVKIAAAYHELGEFERAYLVYRATAEGNFRRESAVAGILESQGEFLRSVAIMGHLVREYPPEPYVAEAQFALSQALSAKAPDAANDARLRAEKINRVELLHRSWTMLEHLLTVYPEDPAADQAAFAAASTQLELGNHAAAAQACEHYARRYPKSSLLDSYWYVIGYCRYAAGEPQAAIAMCSKVAQFTLVDAKTGQPAESVNKWQAVYILGQIYHSLGRPAEAIRHYRQVEKRFPDAQRSVQQFLRKSIELPETSVFRPGQKVELDLKFRNLARCDVKIYRIDLMKFGLLEQSLKRVNGINLAGIRPQYEDRIQLGDGEDYRDRTAKLALPLTKEGAYLVVCRGDDLHASGLVLVSPLAMEVAEDRAAGVVRCIVRDATADRYAPRVQVRVIGSGNQDFVGGATDLRGVFVAEHIRGSVTVIAELEPARYAFYRGGGAATDLYAEEAHADLQAAAPQTPSRRSARARQAVQTAPLVAGGPSAGLAVHPGGIEPGEAAIRAALNRPADIDFVEIPLSEVAELLADSHGIQVQFDKKALDDVGVKLDTPVTRRLRGVTLRSALRLMLRDLDLTYMVADGVLLITTPEQADARLETVVYPVGDLVLVKDESGQTWADFDSLVNLITSTVKPTSWDTVGGPGSIARSEATNTLTLSQTQDVHEAIAAVLDRLREARRQSGAGIPVRPRPTESPSQGAGGMGGMGGGMGGTTGMFGGPPDAAQRPAASPSSNASAAAEPDLLQNVQAANRQSQGKQVERLQKMYKGGKGMGGVGVGGAF
jgi:uncharacterized protein YfaS (alpha-2-macroglobulin family)/TolA-binding protein